MGSRFSAWAFLLGGRMANDLNIQGEVVMSTEQVEAAFDRVGNKAGKMATEVAKSANDAGKAVDSIGDGAEKGAERFTRAEARMRDAIKKSTQELQTLGKTASEKLEFNIDAKGLDASKFAPYIAELKKAEEAQRIASGSLDSMGMSAKATAAALRGVPAQFTDIIASLQGGQAPMTVLLQQGGQLKDMFRGVGNATKALGGYVLGLVNPFTLAAAAVAVLAVAYNSGSKEADAYRSAIILSGNAAGTSVSQLSAYALAISGVVGTQGAAAESLAAMASGGKVTSDVLKEAAQAAVLYERATGQAVDKTAEKFSSLANDPLKAVLKLNDGTNFLTISVYKQIKSLEEQGKAAEATAVAQRAYADSLSSRSTEILNNLGSIERAWLAIKDGAKAGWDAMLGIGREKTTSDKLASVRKEIAAVEGRIASGASTAGTGGFAGVQLQSGEAKRALEIDNARLQSLHAQAAALEGVAYQERQNAEQKAESAKQTQMLTQWDKEGDQFRTKAAKRDDEINKAKVEGQALIAAGLLTEAGLRQRLADINEKYKDKGGASAIKAANKELADQTKLVGHLAGLSSTFYEDWDNLAKAYKRTGGSAEDLAKAQAKLLADQPFMKAQAKDADEAEKSYRKYIDTLGKTADSIEDQALKQDAANASFGKSKVAIAELAMEQAKLAALNAKDAGPWTQEQVDKLKAIAAAHEHYVQSLKEAQYLEASRKYDDEIKYAKEELAIQQYGMTLLGLEETQRQKLLAVRKAELKLEKEIDAIKKQSYDNDPLVNENKRNELIAKARIKAETELQTQIGQIQDQFVTQQAQKFDDIFRQGFADMVNNGSDGLKAFGKSLKTTVLTSVADALYQAFARKYVIEVAASITGMLGGGSGSAASSLLGGGNGVMGLLSNGSSAYSLLSGNSFVSNVSGLLGIGGGTAAAASSLGLSTTLAANAFAGGATVSGLGLGLGGTGLGMTATSAGASAIGAGIGTGAATAGTAAAGTAAAGTSSLAAGLSAIPVWGWIAAAVVAAIGFIVGNDDSGTPHSGSVGSYNAKDGYRQVQNGTELGDNSIDMGMYYGGAEMAKIPETVSKGVVGVLDGLANVFKTDAGYSVTTGFADDSSDDGAWGGLRIQGPDGKDLINWDEGRGKWAPREFSNGEDGLNEYLDAVATDTRKVMLESMDLPTWAKDIVGSISEEDFNLDALQTVVTQIGQVQAVFDGFAETMVGFANLSSEAMGILSTASGGLEQLTTNANAYYENFYSEEERTAKQRELINKNLVGLGLEELDLSAGDAREQFRKLIEEQLALGDSSAETVAALLALSGAVAQVTTSAEDAAAAERERAEALAEEAERAHKEAINYAMRSLEYATNRDVDGLAAQKSALAEQRSLHNESLSLITGIFDLVASNAKDLYGTVDSVAQMQAQQGRAFISDALFAAQRTGYLPEKDALSEAINAARAGIDDGAYSTQFERDADVLKLAGQLSALEEISGKQKTFEELQLDALDSQISAIDKQTKVLQDQLAAAKEALSIAQGEYDATIGTNEALAKFYALIDAYLNPVAAEGSGTSSGGRPTVGAGSSSGDPIKSGATGKGGYYREVETGYGTTYVVDNSQHLKDVDKWLDQYRGTGDVEGMLRAASGTGDISIGDITSVMGWTKKDLEDIADKYGIPKFDVGTNYVPRDMLAMLHEGEAVVPKADNRALMAALNGGGGAGNAALVAEVRALREEVAALRASADRTATNTDKLPQMADQFDNVTEGGNLMRMEAVA